MADETKLHSPILSIFGELVVLGIVVKNWALSVDHAGCRHCCFQRISLIC